MELGAAVGDELKAANCKNKTMLKSTHNHLWKCRLRIS